ncbi:MFS transporter [Cellulomonas soli]|uniref:MFS transporter n=1 Tax=Cellulomonas soli TaxID=931535 RepID=UPI003F84EE41
MAATSERIRRSPGPAGAAVGILLPVTTAILYRAFAEHERGRVVRIVLLPLAVMPALAPVLGGVLADQGLWRLAFLVDVPFVAALVLLGWRRLAADERSAVRAPFDLRGFVLVGLGAPAALVCLASGPTVGWDRPVIVGGLVAAAGLMAAFVRTETRAAVPLIDVRTVRLGAVGVVQVLQTLATVAWMGGVVFTAPLAMQGSVDASATAAGLVTAASAVGVATSAQTIGRLAGRVRPALFFVVGELLVVVVLGCFAVSSMAWDPWLLALLMLVGGVGYGMVSLTIQVCGFDGVPPSDLADVSALTNLVRQLSVALGIALGSAFVALRDDHIRGAFVAFAAVGAVAAAVALLLPARPRGVSSS